MNGKPLLIALVALVALAAAFLPGPRSANAGDPVAITIEPSAPTSQDAVSVTVAGDMGTQFCDLKSASFVDHGKNLIGINVFSTAEICSLLLRPTTFSLTEEIGLLPSGEYTVWVYSNQFDPVDDLELVTFGVSNLSVGGITELPRLEQQPLVADSSDVRAGVLAGVVAAAAAGVLALGGAAWYTRKRLIN